MPADDPTDLLRSASAGDPIALETLLERHLGALLGYVRLHAEPIIRRHESCSDIVQSVCRDVLEDLGEFEYRGEGPFRKWLFTKAMAKLVDRKRYWVAEKRDPRRLRDLPAASTGPGIEAVYTRLFSPSEVAIANEDIARLEAAFDELPDDHRQVIVLAHLCRMSHAEVAAEMGRSEGAVRVLLHRALARLGLAMRAARPRWPAAGGPTPTS